MVNDDGDLDIYLKDGRRHRGRIIKKYKELLKLYTEYSGSVYVDSYHLLQGKKQEVELSSHTKYRVKYYDVHMKDGKVFKKKRIKQNTAGDILIRRGNPIVGASRRSFNDTVKFTEIKKILPNVKHIKDTSSFRWDVVHLKNGNSIRGTNLEVMVENPLRIQMTKDSKELVSHRFDEVKFVFTYFYEEKSSNKKIGWYVILALILVPGLAAGGGGGDVFSIFPINY